MTNHLTWAPKQACRHTVLIMESPLCFRCADLCIFMKTSNLQLVAGQMILVLLFKKNSKQEIQELRDNPAVTPERSLFRWEPKVRHTYQLLCSDEEEMPHIINATQVVGRVWGSFPAKHCQNIMISLLQAFIHSDRHGSTQRGSVVCTWTKTWQPPWRNMFVPMSWQVI